MVSDLNNYKMIDSRSIIDLDQFKLLNTNMDASIVVSNVIDKLRPPWKDFNHNLKHQNEELSYIQFGIHCHIKEFL